MAFKLSHGVESYNDKDVNNSKIVEYDVRDINFPIYNKDDKVLIIDGDVLTYRVASASEFKYKITTPDGKEHIVKSQKSLFDKNKQYNKQNSTIEKIQIPEPFSHCIHSLKTTINSVMKKTGCNKYEIYIGGSGNFRLDLPLPTKYKSNRSELVKPLHLDRSKLYLQSKLGALYVSGREADDVVQMRLNHLKNISKIDVTLYSNDKDAMQGYYGKIYNPTSNKLIELNDEIGNVYIDKNDLKGCGIKWLLAQTCIVGDRTDGYYIASHFKSKFTANDFIKELIGDETIQVYILIICDLLNNLLEDKTNYIDHFGNQQSMTRIELIEMYFQCAYMKVEINDDMTFVKLCDKYAVDVLEYLN